ncbi:DUF4248 domain-containing protein [Bacteroides ilei]|jgi:hypothetical protein|uniref:DUF4248 domain-containing protein n=1 Tax=Bacteroides ilei TaxID=1907658 RepID=UPI00093103C5|nr:DUF4248 domain-containing protein [Bacteroides ilei]
MEEERFKIRAYRKSELAQLYRPEICKASALQCLSRWINRCKPLVEELEKRGQYKRGQFYTASEVRLIVEYLGYPD